MTGQLGFFFQWFMVLKCGSVACGKLRLVFVSIRITGSDSSSQSEFVLEKLVFFYVV